MPQCSFLLFSRRALGFSLCLALTSSPALCVARPVARLLSAQAREQLSAQLQEQVIPLLRRASARSGYRLVSPEEQGLGLRLGPCVILTSSVWGAPRGHEARVNFFAQEERAPESALLALESSPSLGVLALQASACRSVDSSALARLPTLPRSASIAARRYLLRSPQGPLEQLTLLGGAPLPFSFFDWAMATLPPGTPLFDEGGRPVALSARAHPGEPSYQLFIPAEALREFVRSLISKHAPLRTPESARSQRWWGRRLPARAR